MAEKPNPPRPQRWHEADVRSLYPDPLPELLPLLQAEVFAADREISPEAKDRGLPRWVRWSLLWPAPAMPLPEEVRPGVLDSDAWNADDQLTQMLAFSPPRGLPWWFPTSGDEERDVEEFRKVFHEGLSKDPGLSPEQYLRLQKEDPEEALRAAYTAIWYSFLVTPPAFAARYRSSSRRPSPTSNGRT